MSALDLSVVGQALPTTEHSYTWKDAALYALGVGETDLRYVWEGHPEFGVLPGYAVIPAMPPVMEALKRAKADYRKLVHGAQTVTFHRPLPRAGTLKTEAVVREILDKGKGAVVEIDTTTRDADGLLFETSWSIFCRGQGGFGGPRGEKAVLPAPAEGGPTISATFETRADQALLYRLSGDLNPLHVDPALATKVGFEAPILHGLCSWGMALRAATSGLAGGDPRRIARFSARFSGVVYPGDAIHVAMVPAVTDDTFRLDAQVGDRSVLSHGVVELRA